MSWRNYTRARRTETAFIICNLHWENEKRDSSTYIEENSRLKASLESIEAKNISQISKVLN
ncbi:CFC_HP_G0068250.mRNA.1.CDS.1 [Saccharomyces cerevisiae]|nr:CFC_HP_G0068250.mRNA.1.CDS.1 [Saccharomyces cerevisiae]CAI6647865.1 CFC_HP_G0068250.mRNA.1.CDS.1 [Saccharomyces cerevisiae]